LQILLPLHDPHDPPHPSSPHVRPEQFGTHAVTAMVYGVETYVRPTFELSFGSAHVDAMTTTSASLASVTFVELAPAFVHASFCGMKFTDEMPHADPGRMSRSPIP
jgi:hypothetical protein